MPRGGDNSVASVRIGVFGGSFDPVHSAHLIVAESAARQLNLDHVRFVPAAVQPFKPDGHQTVTAHRVEMLRRAVRGNPLFVLDLREIERGGISYMVDTLADLRADFPTDELFLLVGADVAHGLPRWKDVQRIGELAEIVAMSRAGARPPASPDITRTIVVPAVDVSATAVRQAVADRKLTPGLVPPAVAEYIRAHKIYDSGD